MNKTLLISINVALIATLSWASWAARGPASDPSEFAARRGAPPQRGGPPPEAIEACSDRSEGDPCSLELPDGEQLEGTCVSGPDQDSALACLPDRGCGGPPPGPPPQAFAACADKSEGESCSLELPDGEQLEGTCEIGPGDDSELACRPERPPPRHRNRPTSG